MDILRRSLAPVTDEAWKEIDEQAADSLKPLLSARKFVDVVGPLGWDYAAVSTGRLNVPEDQDHSKVCYGVRQVQPLVEARMGFKLSTWELDNVVRGAKDIELEPLQDAAAKIARFEDNAIFNGFEEACIEGIKNTVADDALSVKLEPQAVIDAVSRGQARMIEAGISGPYALVASPKVWSFLAHTTQGGTLRKVIGSQIEGPVIYSASVPDALLVSLRGGDMELVLGSDLAVGCEGYDQHTVHLYLTESFTFRIMEPAAMVAYKIK